MGSDAAIWPTLAAVEAVCHRVAMRIWNKRKDKASRLPVFPPVLLAQISRRGAKRLLRSSEETRSGGTPGSAGLPGVLP
jgi:hypothetical protein